MSFATIKSIRYAALKCGHCGCECGVLEQDITKREYKYITTDAAADTTTHTDTPTPTPTPTSVFEYIWYCASCHNENADLNAPVISIIKRK